MNEQPDFLTAYVSVSSVSHERLLMSEMMVTADSVANFAPQGDEASAAMEALTKRGFRVHLVGDTLRIEASRENFENQFGLKFIRSDDYAKEYKLEGPQDSFAASQRDVFIPSPDTEANLLDLPEKSIDGVAFPQPIALHAAPSANPPAPAYAHLKPEEEVLELLRVNAVHDRGVEGAGVRAAMIDSGFHWSHPYFQTRDYDTRVGLQPQNVLQDPNGHGSGESANLLAVAPRVEMWGLAMDGIIEAFQRARVLGVQVLSNSWGSRWPTDGPNGYWNPYWRLVEREIAQCVLQGMVVLFSGGNGGKSFTASHPDTISIGGVYAERQADGSYNLQASNYASSFDSTRYAGQHVPEVCGLVGMKPRAIYITLPVPPGAELDGSLSDNGAAFPDGDETAPDDGWAVFSGTSAACPQAAGVAALIIGEHGTMPLADIRTRIHQAQDVTAGHSSMGDPAGPGFDAATGHGLVDATQACA